MKKTLQLSVIDFALPCPRTGSIEAYSGYGSAADIGVEIHESLQADRRARNPNYIAERQISQVFEREGRRFTVGGRIDGFIEGPRPRIEEIKSTGNLAELRQRLDSGDHPYLLQLRTYGYFHWLQTGIEPDLTLLLVASRTRDCQELAVELDIKKYEEWLERRLAELVDEAKAFDKIEKRRKAVAETFRFPFPRPRPGQVDLVETVSQSMADQVPLMVQAPTGLGKTAGVMFPALREALARGQKLLYVTPKNSQHAVAEEAISHFQRQGQKVQALTITSKAKMCFKEEVLCNPDHCEFARDYYKKVDEAKLIKELVKKKSLKPRVFRDMGRKFEVCPFELQLDVAPRMDVIICDYNYVFSPRNALGRLAGGLFRKRTSPNLVIDEAHNLPARAMSYFSPTLSSGDLAALGTTLGRLSFVWRAEVKKALDQGLRLIEAARPRGAREPREIDIDAAPFLEHQEELNRLLTRYLESAADLKAEDPVLRLCHTWNAFSERLGTRGAEFKTTFTPHPRGGILRIVCCDASAFLGEAYKSFANVVAFSATLKPFDYYARISGMPSETLKTAEFSSPFPSENRKLMIIPQVSTRWTDRHRELGKIGEAIEKILRQKIGNYFIFFPSFDFMTKVADLVDLPEFSVLRQEREMRAAKIEEYLDQLRRADQPTVIFAVQGGVFSEGVDYPGDMLIGAIVVGPALPSFDLERELLRNYYEEKYGQGFDYAYIYPAMAKVIQSAGRVIRSETDRGLVVLMDRRFVQENYVKSMPVDWVGGSVQSLVSSSVIREISDFWRDGERLEVGRGQGEESP